MHYTRNVSKWLAVLACIASFAGCSALRGDPAADSGFLEHPEKMKEHSERYPFNAVWVSDEYKQNKSDYTRMVIRPVNTSYLMRTGDWKHIKSRSSETIREDAETIAARIEASFRDGLMAKTESAVQVTSELGPNTLVLEVALTELVPTDLMRNTAGDIAGFFVIAGTLVSAGAGGSVAIEARFTDAETNEVLWMFKDREIDQIAPIDLAGLTPYRHVETNITIWANELVELLNSPMDEKVTHALPFTLLPW